MEKTQDVITDESFNEMDIPKEIIKELHHMKIFNPSPIQFTAIPLIRKHKDIIVQAKAGTGKTLVFALHILESVNLEDNRLQAVIVEPVREIAIQIYEVIKLLSKNMKKLKYANFIGGTPVNKDIEKCKNCQIAIGTPGRIYHLMKDGHLNADSVKILVLDEADKLFEDLLVNVVYILSCLSLDRQMVMVSATFPGHLMSSIEEYMSKDTLHVCLNLNEQCLLGISQYYIISEKFNSTVAKLQHDMEKLENILKRVQYNKCIIFSNSQLRTETICKMLIARRLKVDYINARLKQDIRKKIIDNFRNLNGCNLLVSTDLTSRGIDINTVNLVVNIDIPETKEVYLHRIGRAGRFGSKGVSISFISGTEELDNIQKYSEDKIINFANIKDDEFIITKMKDYVDADSIIVQKLNINPKLVDNTVKHVPIEPCTIIYKNENTENVCEITSVEGVLSTCTSNITDYFENETTTNHIDLDDKNEFTFKKLNDLPGISWVKMNYRLPPPNGINLLKLMEVPQEKVINKPKIKKPSKPKNKEKNTKNTCVYCHKTKLHGFNDNSEFHKLISFIYK
ncbi:hypothetical protein A3Q56_02232 [Intoshia linei]|uniref:ATP-dependent RNA helicase n=1 Tax=Intoshia linei TaxID=1819745 RepID=A0A177B9C2_9BILA|nr:hypothetical protein A3Q56_02232 [Intoshia linei]